MCCGLDMCPEIHRDVYRCSTCGRQVSGMEWAEFVGGMRWTLRKVAWWLGWVWALPVTLAGLLLVAFTDSSIEGVREAALVCRAGDWFTRNFFKRFGMGACMWGCVLMIRGDHQLTPGTLAHELVHFKQARIFGLFLPVAYGVGALWALARGKSAYRENPMEIWARRESGH